MALQEYERKLFIKFSTGLAAALVFFVVVVLLINMNQDQNLGKRNSSDTGMDRNDYPADLDYSPNNDNDNIKGNEDNNEDDNEDSNDLVLVLISKSKLLMCQQLFSSFF